MQYKQCLSFLLFLLTAFHAGPSRAAQTNDPVAQEACSEAEKTPLPPQASHIAPPPQSHWPLVDGCDEKALYYGFHGVPDYRAALACGYLQRAYPDKTIGDPFAGPGILSMLYANGFGVPRNYDLALRFTCENTWAAPAELSGRIEHLQVLKKAARPSAKPFDLCDDITSGLSMGACEQVSQNQKAGAREQQIDALVKTMPLAAQQLFPALQAAEKTFENTRVDHEIDLSGTARAAFQIEDLGKLQDQFLLNLGNFAKGLAPHPSVAQAADAQDAEEKAFAVTQSLPEAKWQAFGTVRPQGIAATERDWKVLRAVWLQFAAVAYPRLPKASIATEVDRLRTHQLKSLVPPS